MDINTLLTLRQSWNTFKENHPKFPGFLRAVKNRGPVEGAEVFISVTYPDGETLKAGLKLKDTDIGIYDVLLSLLR